MISIKLVATNGHNDEVLFGLAWAHDAHEIGVGDLAIGGHIVGQDEMNGTISENSIGSSAIFENALSAATPLVGEGGHPDGVISALEKGIDGLGTAGGWMEHFALNGRIVLNGLGKMEDLAGRGWCGGPVKRWWQ